MGQVAKLGNGRSQSLALPLPLWRALRIAPWLVFGPITGFMSERAIACFRNREPALGALYVLANVSILIALPTLTALIANRTWQG